LYTGFVFFTTSHAPGADTVVVTIWSDACLFYCIFVQTRAETLPAATPGQPTGTPCMAEHNLCPGKTIARLRQPGTQHLKIFKCRYQMGGHRKKPLRGKHLVTSGTACPCALQSKQAVANTFDRRLYPGLYEPDRDPGPCVVRDSNGILFMNTIGPVEFILMRARSQMKFAAACLEQVFHYFG
jgi:hypothetical protein